MCVLMCFYFYFCFWCCAISYLLSFWSNFLQLFMAYNQWSRNALCFLCIHMQQLGHIRLFATWIYKDIMHLIVWVAFMYVYISLSVVIFMCVFVCCIIGLVWLKCCLLLGQPRNDNKLNKMLPETALNMQMNIHWYKKWKSDEWTSIEIGLNYKLDQFFTKCSYKLSSMPFNCNCWYQCINALLSIRI